MNRIRAALFTLAFPLAAPADAALLTATPATLATQLTAAKPGDTIALAASATPYGPITIKNRVLGGVTLLTCGATLSVVGIYQSSGLDIEGCGGAPGGQAGGEILNPGNFGIIMEGASNIAVRGMVIDGSVAAAMTIQYSDHITLTGNAMRGEADGVDWISSIDGDIERNICVVPAPAPGHADCGQFWNIAGQSQVARVRIAWNAALGYAQGWDNAGSLTAAPGSTAITALNNTYAGAFGTAIGFGACADCSMIGNVSFTLSTTPKGTYPGLMMTAGADGAAPVMTGNVVGPKN